ncbi:hypothetical protein [Paenibacillus xylanexedens]|uniref:hypothetical protein n=1 Tax=Paenibacillus xylanexedens TaxID=528191 RepID=UPI00142E6D29|nr:hypothetical protein [Paenibacillus xylanexedens]
MFEEDERLIGKRITLITYDGADPIERVNDWIKDNMPEYNPADNERLEITIEIKVRK